MEFASFCSRHSSLNPVEPRFARLNSPSLAGAGAVRQASKSMVEFHLKRQHSRSVSPRSQRAQAISVQNIRELTDVRGGTGISGGLHAPLLPFTLCNQLVAVPQLPRHSKASRSDAARSEKTRKCVCTSMHSHSDQLCASILATGTTAVNPDLVMGCASRTRTLQELDVFSSKALH